MEDPLELCTVRNPSRADPVDYDQVVNPYKVVEDMLQESALVVKKEESEDDFMNEDNVEALMTIVNNEVIIKVEPPDDTTQSEFGGICVKKEEYDPLDPEVQECQAVLISLPGKNTKSCLKKSGKGKKKTGKTLKPFVCYHCKYACRSLSGLKVHIQSHTGEKPFACDQCDYRAGIRTHLANHKRIHTGERPFECKFCGYRAYQLGNLLEHEKVHSDIRPFKCDYCNYRAKRRRHLTGHLLIHKGQRPYQCDFCEFKTSNSQNLKYHVRLHTGERPHKCDYCNYRSAQKGSLNLHMKRHTGEKIYKCDHCDFRCLRELSMRTHLYMHTGNTPFSCYNCGFSTSYKPTLAKHIQGCHEKSSRIKKEPGVPDQVENECQKQFRKTVKRRNKFTRMSRFDTEFGCSMCEYTTTYKPALGRHVLTHKNYGLSPKKTLRVKVKPNEREFKGVLDDPPQPVERSLRKRAGLKQPGRFSDYLLSGSEGDDPSTASHDAPSSGDECWIEEL
uniref:Zinc finger protein 226 n=1 Tax=Lygus hesperus TaxID=30085 RepID=A0A146L1B4_LYGHE